PPTRTLFPYTTLFRSVVEGQPTLFEIWVCCDGYWADHTKNLCPGELEPRYAELEQALTAVYDEAVASLRDGAELAGLDRLVREGDRKSTRLNSSHRTI